MKATTIIDYAMVFENVSKSELARRLGNRSPSSITNAINRENGPRIDTFVRIMDAMGYEVIVRKRGEGKGFAVTDS